MTAAKACPDWMPKTATATAMAGTPLSVVAVAIVAVCLRFRRGHLVGWINYWYAALAVSSTVRTVSPSTSTGAQGTVSPRVPLEEVARACGYARACRVREPCGRASGGWPDRCASSRPTTVRSADGVAPRVAFGDGGRFVVRRRHRVRRVIAACGPRRSSTKSRGKKRLIDRFFVKGQKPDADF